MYRILNSFPKRKKKTKLSSITNSVHKREQHVSFLWLVRWPRFVSVSAGLNIFALYRTHTHKKLQQFSSPLFGFIQFFLLLHVCFWRLNDTLSQTLTRFHDLFAEIINGGKIHNAASIHALLLCLSFTMLSAAFFSCSHVLHAKHTPLLLLQNDKAKI